jgi:hypothetical protein
MGRNPMTKNRGTAPGGVARHGVARHGAARHGTNRRELLKGAAGLMIAAGPAGAALAQSGEKSWQAAGMTFRWRHQGGELVGTLTAPTLGWLALGFNPGESMPGTRFLIAAHNNGRVRAEVHTANVDGTHEPIMRPANAASPWLPAIQASSDEMDALTQLHFAIPYDAFEFGGLSLVPGSRVFAMMAWSESPDFDHHSRERVNDWVVL